MKLLQMQEAAIGEAPKEYGLTSPLTSSLCVHRGSLKADCLLIYYFTVF